MTTRWQLTFDAAEPARLAEFWCAALGYLPAAPPAGFASWDAWYDQLDIPADDRTGVATIADPDGARPSLCFLRVPEGKAGKNRLHVDVQVGGGRQRPYDERWAVVEAARDRLVPLGATVGQVVAGEDGRPDHLLMHDPEGNEFCLV